MSVTEFSLPSLELIFPERVAGCLAAFVEALTRLDIAYLELHPETPRLYLSNVRYAEVPRWQDVPSLLQSGRGDCKSIVAWRLAEMRGSDPNASIHVVHRIIGQEDHLHVLIRRSDDRLEDPSVKLGMKPWF